jgi:hypothetical protein
MLSADRKFQEAENMRKSLEADRAKYLKVRNLVLRTTTSRCVTSVFS